MARQIQRQAAPARREPIELCLPLPTVPPRPVDEENRPGPAESGTDGSARAIARRQEV